MKKKKLLIIMVCAALVLSGCTIQSNLEETKDEDDISREPTVEINEQKDINDTPIIDSTSVYSSDDLESVVYFYVTVREGAKGTETDHTFNEVNAVLKYQDEVHVNADVKAEALVQVGDETGPLNQMLGYGQTENNATIEVRGNSSSVAAQKSYTLKLFDNTILWRSQKKIALVKSFYDATRMRNKLFFDLLKEIPDVPTLRTQFVRLFIKDETSGEKAFNDYGLYTQVETPNKRYLKNHELDGSGYLYKANSFNFELNDAIKNFNDENFDENQFDLVLSCYGVEDNTRLIEMINAVNDSEADIDTIVDTYFDRDNYITWLAYNILMGNIDTTMQNFYLYSPINGNKWYFIPWDGDGCLLDYENYVKNKDIRPEWEEGISNYWGVILHQKFLSIESNREQLTAKIELLKNQYLTRENVNSHIEKYNNTIGSYPVQMPDLLYLSVTPKQRTDILNHLYDEIEENYENYYKTLEGLMPFFLESAAVSNGSVHFTWGESYDMQGKLVDYSLLLSTTPDFSNVIYEEDNNRVFSADVDGLQAGQYYWKVIATSEDGREAEAFNQVSVDDVRYYGIESLVIE